MKITLTNYSTDGTSLSEDRCAQIYKVAELCDNIGGTFTTYKDLQKKADEEKIFGTTKADSLIRTVFPLLKKLGFVSYPDNSKFQACSLFTPIGKSFLLVIEARRKANELREAKAVEKITLALEKILQLGIYNMANSSFSHHNILLAIEILKLEKEIIWNEFLYVASLAKSGKSLKEVMTMVRNFREKKEPFEYFNRKGSPVANTAYSYVRTFLNEAGIISNGKSSYSTLNSEAIPFILTLPTYDYN